jgi:hypothetical protein
MSWRALCCWNNSIAASPFSRDIRIMGDIDGRQFSVVSEERPPESSFSEKQVPPLQG